MPVHFSAEEMSARRARAADAINSAGLDGLLIFKQESMYYLTGYDTFGFSMFQCLHMDANGHTTLLTRLPDLRQAQYTSDIKTFVCGTTLRASIPAKNCVRCCRALAARGNGLVSS